MASEFQVSGQNAAAQFTLKVHRGDGMALLAMNWKKGKPPLDFVGFAIEYKEPAGTKFFVLNNRLGFRGTSGNINPNALSTRLSPIQKFRWVHFPRNAEIPGAFLYRVTPDCSMGDGAPWCFWTVEAFSREQLPANVAAAARGTAGRGGDMKVNFDRVAAMHRNENDIEV